MARRNTGPRYYASKGGYYITRNHKRICLIKGPEDDKAVREQAEQRYHEIMLADEELAKGDEIRCVRILDAFLEYVRTERKANPYNMWKRMYEAFDDEFNDLLVSQLTTAMVNHWLRKMERPRKHKTRGDVCWGPGTRRIAITALKAAFNWAASDEAGLISHNPIAGMKKPAARSRSREQLISEDEYQQLLQAANPWFRDYLVVLNDTGARPGEIMTVTAADFNPQHQAFFLKDHKTDRIGDERVIYVPDRAMKIVQRLITKYPEGPLFRNRHGRKWRTETIAAQFIRLRDDLGLKNKVTAYSLRHKFATEFLTQGGTKAYLAELMGNSERTLEYHYNHLRENRSELLNAVKRFRPSSDASPTIGTLQPHAGLSSGSDLSQ